MSLKFQYASMGDAWWNKYPGTSAKVR